MRKNSEKNMLRLKREYIDYSMRYGQLYEISFTCVCVKESKILFHDLIAVYANLYKKIQSNITKILKDKNDTELLSKSSFIIRNFPYFFKPAHCTFTGLLDVFLNPELMFSHPTLVANVSLCVMK